MKYITIVIIAAILLLAYFIPIPNEGQINFKSGTIRYRYLGIPITSRELPKYKSEWASLNMEDSWATVVEYPLSTSNNTDAMIVRYVCGIAVWSMYDKDVAKLLAIELVDYIKSTRVRIGLPAHSIYYSAPIVDISNGKLTYEKELIGPSDDKIIKKINTYFQTSANHSLKGRM